MSVEENVGRGRLDAWSCLDGTIEALRGTSQT
jgi:hypothetical protein